MRGVDKKRLKIMSTADSVQYRDLLRCTILWSHRTSSVPTQVNWNRQIPCARQGKTEAFRSRLGNWIMNSPCDNWRPVGRLEADTWGPETQFLSYSSVTKRLIRVLFCIFGMHSDTLTLRLVSLSYCLLIANTWLWKGATWKREEARTLYATFNHCFMRSPCRCKLEHRLW